MRSVVALLTLLIFLTIQLASVSAQSDKVPTIEELQKRIDDLEKQLKAVSLEVAKFKQASSPTEAAKSETVAAKPAAKAEPEPAKKRDLGVDVGSARLTPYGIVFFNAFGNSGGTNNADIPLFATPTGVGNVGASARQTRLGVRLEGARVGNANLKAVVEADFFGGFPSVGIGENFGVVRLRLANIKLDWEKTSLTAGQDWMIFAPVSPVSLVAQAIPQMAAAGNNWARLPQVKIERKLTDRITWSGAVLSPQTGDFSTNAAFFLQPTSGSASRSPFFQSRIAYAGPNWLGTKKSGSVGIAAHYGRSRVFTGPAALKHDIDSFGVALDWSFPLATTLSVSGEAFFGRNLGGFQSGIFQNYNNDFAYRSGSTLVAGGVRAIGTRGGWAQIGFTPPVLQNRLGLYASLGIDDPNNKDLVSLSHRDWRTRNLVVAADLIFKITPQFSIGAEVRRLQTNYFYIGRQRANHVNLAAAYSF